MRMVSANARSYSACSDASKLPLACHYVIHLRDLRRHSSIESEHVLCRVCLVHTGTVVHETNETCVSVKANDVHLQVLVELG